MNRNMIFVLGAAGVLGISCVSLVMRGCGTRERVERYDNGKVKTRYAYAVDAHGSELRHGLRESYYEDGSRKLSMSYKEGAEDREQDATIWYKNGAVAYTRKAESGGITIEKLMRRDGSPGLIVKSSARQGGAFEITRFARDGIILTAWKRTDETIEVIHDPSGLTRNARREYELDRKSGRLKRQVILGIDLIKAGGVDKVPDKKKAHEIPAIVQIDMDEMRTLQDMTRDVFSDALAICESE